MKRESIKRTNTSSFNLSVHPSIISSSRKESSASSIKDCSCPLEETTTRGFSSANSHQQEIEGMSRLSLHERSLQELEFFRDGCVSDSLKMASNNELCGSIDSHHLSWCQETGSSSQQRNTFSVLSYSFQQSRRRVHDWDVQPAIHSSLKQNHQEDSKEISEQHASRKPGRPKKTRRPSTNEPSGTVEASAPDEDSERVTVSLLRESLTVMIDDLVDLCSPRLRSALTPDQRNKYYGPLKEHAKHIRETQDVGDLLEYMRLYFDRYMLEKMVPSEDPSYSCVFALLNALAIWLPPRGQERPLKALNLGSDTSGGGRRSDLLDDILSDRSAQTDAEIPHRRGPATVSKRLQRKRKLY